jgi:hypothetical protein
MQDGNSSNFEMVYILETYKKYFHLIVEVKLGEDDLAIIYKHITKFDIIGLFHS